jgi:hypothetical protein
MPVLRPRRSRRTNLSPSDGADDDQSSLEATALRASRHGNDAWLLVGYQAHDCHNIGLPLPCPARDRPAGPVSAWGTCFHAAGVTRAERRGVR